MRGYFLKRCLLLLVTLWGITLASFVMLQLAPGSPLEMKLQQDKGGGLGDRSSLSGEMLERLKKQYHMDRPILERYWMWLKDIATLNFGESFTDHRPVITKIMERLPVSLVFGLVGLLLSLGIGIPLGLWSASRPGSFGDRSVAFVSIALYAMPSYVLGILLLTFLGTPQFLDWFPIYGIQSDTYEQMSFFGKVLDRLHHFILPCICYSIGGLAYISQQQRASILECMSQDYIRTARAKGLSESKVYLRHAFRNSLIPIATIFGAMVPGILGASVIIEALFSIPGLGLLGYESLLQRDYPTIMANFTIGGFLTLFGLFLSDLFYVMVDPRIHFGALE